LTSCKAAEDAGFGAVSVNDVRAKPLQFPADAEQGLQILERTDSAYKSGQHAQVKTAVLSPLFERTFGTQPGTCNQADFVSKQMVLVINSVQGVLLRSADDQTSDDMSCSHGSLKRLSEAVKSPPTVAKGV